MTLNGLMAVILRYPTEIVSFGSQLRQSGQSGPHNEICSAETLCSLAPGSLPVTLSFQEPRNMLLCHLR